jgi:hypothetical protein
MEDTMKAPVAATPKKNPFAVGLGKLSSASRTPEERSTSARHASVIRWEKTRLLARLRELEQQKSA